MNKIMTYEDTIIKNGVVYGRWNEYFEDVDTGKNIKILRHEAVCYENEFDKLKKKQSRLYKDKWAVNIYNENEMEFPEIMFYIWKRGKTPKKLKN